jgi:hypothetical protein
MIINHFSMPAWWKGLEKQCEISKYYLDTGSCPPEICPLGEGGTIATK